MISTMKALPIALAAILMLLQATTSVWAQSRAPWPAMTAPSEAPLQQDLAALYHQHILAINRGDLTAVVADYASNATFIAPGAGPCAASAPCVGTEAIRSLWQALITSHIQAGIISLQASGNTVTGSLNSITDSQRTAGFGVLRIKVTVTYAGDKIARDVVEYDATHPATANYVNFVRLTGVLRQFYDAVNRGDADAAIAFFADDAVAVLGGRCPVAMPCVGKAAILRTLLAQRDNQTRITIVSLSAAGDTIAARVEVRNIPVTAQGFERVISPHTVIFKGDQIARFESELDLSDPQTAAFTNYTRVSGPSTLRAEARRRGDIAGAMATYADDAVVEGWGLCTPRPCVGKAAIQREVERAVADGEEARLVTGTARVSGNTRTARLEIRSDSIRAAGLERVIALVTEEVPVDKTVFVHFVLDATDAQTAAYLTARPTALPRTGEGSLLPAALLAALAGGASLTLGWLLRRRTRLAP